MSTVELNGIFSPRRYAGRALAVAAAMAAALAAPATVHSQAAAADSTSPTLVVMITVDQLRGDYPDVFRSTLSGGLARLTREGAWFVNGMQDHANTETAPGHSGALSGRLPRSHGIVLNAAGVPDEQAPLIGGGGAGASPFRFRGSSFIDWLRMRDPRSRALSVSRKDRGAILPLGRAKQHAFWWASDGRFTTSTYYADSLPDWVNAFNARQSAAALAGRMWTPLLDESRYAEPDTVAAERPGSPVEAYTFPYMVPENAEDAARALPNYPWMDSLTVDIALEGLVKMGLGQGPQIDLLAVSLSTTDAVGHMFGPDSRELHDQVVRVDREIGRFLDSLFTLRDRNRVIVALTADHGVSPLPGVASRYPNSQSVRVNLGPAVTAAREALVARGVGEEAFGFSSGELRLDRGAFAAAGVNADSVVDAFGRAVLQVPGVLRVDRWSDAMRADTTADDVARRILHMYPDDLIPDLVVSLTPYSAWGNATYHQHGAPHDPDALVPVIFWGSPFTAGRHERRVRVVDIAPTISAALGVTPTEKLDGVILREALNPVVRERVGAQPQR
ncbi:MAG TPA: alkaline phosphatase family protein [Gemmatimonadales bacterium]|nr:alkaline phosphatase family protein [Gemmatimonadales bacterium]